MLFMNLFKIEIKTKKKHVKLKKKKNKINL